MQVAWKYNTLLQYGSTPVNYVQILQDIRQGLF